MAQKKSNIFRWTRWSAGALLVVLLLTVLASEWRAHRALNAARAAGTPAALEDVAIRFPFSTAVIGARAAASNLPDAGLTLREQLHPLRVDWLALWGWPACAGVLMLIALTRLNRRNRWAGVALGLAVLASAVSVLAWGWFGLPAGGGVNAVVNLCTPALSKTGWVYAVTWLMILLTASMLFCPLGRPGSDKPNAPAKVRPASPNDPRAALAHLQSQRQEGVFTNVEYARRREAILSRI